MRAADYTINLSNRQNQPGKHEEIARELVGLTVIDLTKLPNSFLATKSGYYGIKELEEKERKLNNG